MLTPYITGGYRYQGTGIGPSGGLLGRVDQPPGRVRGGGRGDGYDPGDGDEEEDENDATSSSSENLREVFPPKAGPMDLGNDWCPRRRQASR